MKTQQEITIQFSGYPLRVVQENPKPVKTEMIFIKSSSNTAPLSAGELLANNPQNWDVDWFNSYE